jgi:hypothetical protein
MDIDNKKNQIEIEEDNAEKALEEWERMRETKHRCLRCGGEFEFDIKASGYSIKCKREGCFVMTVRGI